MLTEKQNVAGVDLLIKRMVDAGCYDSEKRFREAVMEFISVFSEHVGEKYNIRAYSKFLNSLEYRRDLIDDIEVIKWGENRDEDLEQDLDLEHGLWNTLDVLNCFFTFLIDKVSADNQSSKDGDEDAFLFTAIREARKLQKRYIENIDDIISSKSAIFRSFPDKGDAEFLIRQLERGKEFVASYDFNSDFIIAIQKKRKKNALYKSGARTNQPWDFSKMDKNDEKQVKKFAAEFDDFLDTNLNNPWNRAGRFKSSPRPKSKES